MSGLPSNRRGLLARGMLLLTSIGLVLGLGELVARATWVGEEEEATPTAPDLKVFATATHLNRPGLHGIFKGRYVRTNSQGLRGPEYTERPAEGRFRIAITGDSVTMGSGVDEEDAYPAQLELLLDPEREGTFEVLNVGLAGIDIHRAMQRLERAIAHYHPDLVVYGFTINDIEGPAYRRLAASDESLRLIRRLRAINDSPSYLYRWAMRRWVSISERYSPTRSSYPYEVRENFLMNPQAWKAFTAGLDRFAGLARRAGLCGQVLIHTHLANLDDRHEYLDVYQRVTEAARARGLHVASTFEYLEGEREESLWVNLLDPHPSRAGHAIYARALYDGLRSLPPECGSVSAAARPSSETRG